MWRASDLTAVASLFCSDLWNSLERGKRSSHHFTCRLELLDIHNVVRLVGVDGVADGLGLLELPQGPIRVQRASANVPPAQNAQYGLPSQSADGADGKHSNVVSSFRP